MYVCPVCNREFKEELSIQWHFLSCWKEKNPYHVAKPAHRSEDVNTRSVGSDVMDFFNSFSKR